MKASILAPLLLVLLTLAGGAAAAGTAATAGAPKPAAAAARVVNSPAMRRADVAPGAGDAELPGVGALAKRDVNFRETEAVSRFYRGPWDLWVANFERSQSPQQLEEQRLANRRLRNQPVPATPENTIPGKCVPFKPPAPYKGLQEYCTALTRMPWQEAKKMFLRAQAPVESVGVGVRGCTVGCVIGDNIWANVVTFTPALGRSWTGKCIVENSEGKQVEVLQALCPNCGGIYSRRPWNTGLPSDAGMPGVTVYLGKSWLDGQPAYVFDYSKVFRTYGVDFHGSFDSRDLGGLRGCSRLGLLARPLFSAAGGEAATHHATTAANNSSPAPLFPPKKTTPHPSTTPTQPSATKCACSRRAWPSAPCF
jgi:hypothetical protein